MLESQNYSCAICKLPVSEDQAVLDHCHKGGHVRAVLHRSCNSLLGKVENNGPRYGMSTEQIFAFLNGAAAYLELHKENQTQLIHPTFFTEEEKKERRRVKAKKARAAKKLAKKPETL
jgi:hypothetical protein